MKKAIENLKTWLLKKLQTFQESKQSDKTPSERDEEHYIRFGWRVVLIGFGGFMIWALFAPLDKGVSASGFVLTEGYARLVQPVDNGRIEEVLVKEGEHVIVGQPLIKLNEIQANSQYRVAEEEISGLQGKIQATEVSVASRKSQLNILSQQLESNRQLAREGYVPKSKVLDLERAYAQTQDQLHDSVGQLEYLKRQLNETQEKYKNFAYSLDNTTLKSPVAGSVINLTALTAGQVVPAGTKLMTVVPDDEPLVVEAQVPVHLIDKVHNGLPVELLFAAFNVNTTPRIPAVVVMVSGDRLVDERIGPFYKVRAQVTQEGMKKLKQNRVRPGMPVEVFIVTGERTMMSYLLKPIFDRAHSALREE